MIRDQKQAVISSLSDICDRSFSVFFLEHNALAVKGLEPFRKELKLAKAGMKVVKKSFVRKIMGPKFDSVKSCKGQLAMLYSSEIDCIPVFKIACNFVKNNSKNCSVLGGFVGQDVCLQNQILDLSKLSSIVDLRVRFLSLLKSSMQRFHYIIKNRV